MGDVVAYAAVGYYAYKIYKANREKPAVLGGSDDEDRATYAERGSFVPWLLGARRVGAVILWVGDRVIKNEPTGASSGGGGKGRKKTGKAALQPIYYESAQHGICVGPASRLARIWRNGRVVYDTPIDAASNPSGSSFQDIDEQTFTIYWGERDQAKNALIVDRTGIDSKRPNLCYVVWEEVKLGPSPRWPVLEYEIEVNVYRNVNRNGSSEENEVTYERDFGDGAGGYLFTAADPALNGGYVEENLAHKIDQLLFEQYPQGIGISPRYLHLASLEMLAERAESEEILTSLIASGGKSARGVLQGVLDDHGIAICWQGLVEAHPSTAGRFTKPGLFFYPIRDWATISSFTPPTIPDDAATDAEVPEIEVEHWPSRGTKVSFALPDRGYEYAEQTITIDDDGAAVIDIYQEAS